MTDREQLVKAYVERQKDVARYKEQFESLKKQRDELKKQFNKTED